MTSPWGSASEDGEGTEERSAAAGRKNAVDMHCAVTRVNLIGENGWL